MQYIKYSPVPGVKTETAKLFRKNKFKLPKFAECAESSIQDENT